MYRLVLLVSLAAVAFAANGYPTTAGPSFLNNPDYFKYQQNQNPYYNNNPYQNRYTNNYRYNQPNYLNKDYQRYNQNNNYNKDYYNKDYYNNKNYYNPERYQQYNQDARAAGILRFVNDANPDGSYQYAYETQNGISAEQQGAPRPAADQSTPVVVQGYYRFTSPEGVPVEVRYTADEFGYHPQGTIIPGPGQATAYRSVVPGLQKK
ncbi:hypothetical protein JTB14_020929 [Gonioctena quinquepunctata]|nr:hypothetical protein JTB14_020929 [Gonioctena quinquepunctata]